MQTICFIDLDATIMTNPFATAVFPVLMREMATQTGLSPKVLMNQVAIENRRRQQQAPNDPLTMDWDDIIQTIAKRNGAQLSDRTIDLVRENCEEPHISMLDEAYDVLKELKAAGCKLVVASKGLSKYQDPVLQALGLDTLFDDFLMPDLTGYLKTDPRFYAAYTDQPDDRLFIQVGDHHYDDVVCTRRLGFYSVMRAPIADLEPYDPFTRTKHLPAYWDQVQTYSANHADILPDAVVVHLKEVPPVVAQIQQRASADSKLID